MLQIISARINTAKLQDSYDYSSVQIDLPQDIASQIKEWSKHNISNQDIYTEDGDRSYGRENEIHITVKYGLHTSNVSDVEKAIKGFGSFRIRLGEVSRFVPQDKDYEVIKIDVSGKKLHDLNRLISDNLKNSDQHPVYRPHLTIAYVKSGTCNNLSGNADFAGQYVEVNKVTFSDKGHEHTDIDLD